MSLTLNTDTQPPINIRANPVTGGLWIDGANVGLHDVCHLIRHALISTDLVPHDPRLALLEEIKTLTVVPGYNRSQDLLSHRLGHPES